MTVNGNVDNHFQLYGFQPPEFVDATVFDKFVREYKYVLDRRKHRWDEFYAEDSYERGVRLKRFCRKGIPAENRQQMWLLLSGASERMKRDPDAYARAVHGDLPKNLDYVILADVPRTFPENSYFNGTNGPTSKLDSLKRVLTAFAIHCPEVGYCQGFNYIVAHLLLALQGSETEVEEQAFWLLDALVNHILPAYYTNDMLAVRTDCVVFEELLRKKLPKVYNVIKTTGVNATVLVARWFICLFANVLPFETVQRIFDCLFYEGDKILFRVCLALVRLFEAEILKCTEFPMVIKVFQSICLNQETLRCHDFLKTVFKLSGSLSKATILQLRQQCVEIVRAESTR